MTQDATSNHWNHLIAPKNQGVCKFCPTEYVILMMGKKSCTKWDVLNPVIDGQFTTSTGAGILLSTVYCFVQPCPSPSINFVVPQFWGHVFFESKIEQSYAAYPLLLFWNQAWNPYLQLAACLKDTVLTYLLACLLAGWLAYLLTYLLFPNGILTKKGKPFKMNDGTMSDNP